MIKQKTIKREMRKETWISENTGTFPLRSELLGYVINILKRTGFSEDLADFIFSILGSPTRRKLVKILQENDDGDKSLFDSMMNHEIRHHRIGSYLQGLIDNHATFTPTTMEEILLDICRQELNIPEMPQEYNISGQFQELRSVFACTSEELEIITFIYCCNDYDEFETFLRLYQHTRLHQVIASATGLKTLTVRKILAKNSRLYQMGLFEECRGYGDIPTLHRNLFDFISGVSDKSLIETFYLRDEGEVLPLNNFSISEDSTGIIQDLIQSAPVANILIYGEAGTGKTEFVRSIIRKTGRDPFFLQYGRDGSLHDRHLALNAALSGLGQKKDAVLVIDEADSLLNLPFLAENHRSGALDKGWTNNLFDHLPVKLVWITNHVESIEASTLRRFSYSLEFKAQSLPERYRIWHSLLKKHRLNTRFKNKEIGGLSRSYPVNAAGIATTVQTLADLDRNNLVGTGKANTITRELLTRHHALTRGNYPAKNLNPLVTTYHPDVLNISPGPQKILCNLQQFLKSIREQSSDSPCGINLLFWGYPGTGKTEFTKYLADKLQSELLVKRASDLESKWIGETEKNISLAFAEAEREGAVLLLDEADSFFTRRESAFRSWEVSRTNELLTQMENHRVILICCTNLIDHLDPASLRRFDWKVEFKPLTPESKVILYRQHFTIPGKKLTLNLKERISRIPDLTPGDFKAVRHRNRFTPSEVLTHALLMDELAQEVSYHQKAGKKIGFIDKQKKTT